MTGGRGTEGIGGDPTQGGCRLSCVCVCVCPPQESNLLIPLLPHNPATILSVPTFFQNEDFVTYLRPHFSFMIVGFANDESPA